ncbi:uncharacterized protein MELLADRAFT_77029 [Melampsora larici-populina 98AG31]|uniref:Uncharacterized protein n=1 Tax=Melampsora larici-populina (strain 98AG31 / pathotype 3-4-7) TaxID=747676 RepID=F4RCI7_MELLP|nr:uncharacterized protein MELLADRAFT_77029 [Melampsora larici-populina 98AG31]EGG09958.1 hypothetical protein MELLADRAFT_77029 [Melampsora larici-populina 98AG31]
MGIKSEAKPTVKRSTLWFLNPLSTGFLDPFEGVPEKGVKRKPKNPNTNTLNPISIPTSSNPTPLATPNLTPTSPQPSNHTQSTGMKIKLKWSGASLQNDTSTNSSHEPIPSTSTTPYRSSNLRVNIKLNPNRTSLTPETIEEEKPNLLSLSPASCGHTSDSDQSSESSDDHTKSIEVFQGLIRPSSIHRRKPKNLCYKTNPRTQRLSSIFSTFYPPLFGSFNKTDEPNHSREEDLKANNKTTTEEDGMLVDHELWPAVKSSSRESGILMVRREEKEIEEIEEIESDEEEDSDSRLSAEPEDYAEMMVSRTDEWDRWRERRKSDEGGEDSNFNTPRSFSLIHSRRVSGVGILEGEANLSYSKEDETHHWRRERTKSGKWVSNQMGFGSNQDLNVTLLEDEVEMGNSEVERIVSNEDQRIGMGGPSLINFRDDPQALVDLDSSIITEPITLIEQVPSIFDDLNEEPIMVERPPDRPQAALDQSLTSLADKLGFTSLCETRGESSFDELEESLSEDESECKPMLSSGSESESESDLNRNRIRKTYELDEEGQERILKRLKLDLVENLDHRSSSLSSSSIRSCSLPPMMSSPLSPLLSFDVSHHHEHAFSFDGIESDEELVVVEGEDDIALEELDEVWNQTNHIEPDLKPTSNPKESDIQIKEEEPMTTITGLSSSLSSSEFLTSASKPKKFMISEESSSRTTTSLKMMKIWKSVLDSQIGEVYVLKLSLMMDFKPFRTRKFGNDWVLIRRIEDDLVHLPSLIGILKIEEEEIEKIIEEESEKNDDRRMKNQGSGRFFLQDWIGLDQAQEIVERFECIVSTEEVGVVKRFLSLVVDLWIV